MFNFIYFYFYLFKRSSFFVKINFFFNLYFKKGLFFFIKKLVKLGILFDFNLLTNVSRLRWRTLFCNNFFSYKRKLVIFFDHIKTIVIKTLDLTLSYWNHITRISFNKRFLSLGFFVRVGKIFFLFFLFIWNIKLYYIYLIKFYIFFDFFFWVWFFQLSNSFFYTRLAFIRKLKIYNFQLFPFQNFFFEISFKIKNILFLTCLIDNTFMDFNCRSGFFLKFYVPFLFVCFFFYYCLGLVKINYVLVYTT
jgi:hypothetical protein